MLERLMRKGRQHLEQCPYCGRMKEEEIKEIRDSLISAILCLVVAVAGIITGVVMAFEHHPLWPWPILQMTGGGLLGVLFYGGYAFLAQNEPKCQTR